MKLPLLLLIQLCSSMVHAPTPTLTITKDENSETLVGPGGKVLLTPFTVSDTQPDNFYIASVDYVTNGEQLPNLPPSQFAGIDELNRYLRNNVLAENQEKSRDIQIVLRVLKPSTNTMVTSYHQLAGMAASATVALLPVVLPETVPTLDGYMINTGAVVVNNPPITVNDAPLHTVFSSVHTGVPQSSDPMSVHMGVPQSSNLIHTGVPHFPPAVVDGIATPPDVTITVENSQTQATPALIIATGHHHVTGTKAILLDVQAKSPILSTKLPLAIAKLLPPYSEHQVTGFHSLGDTHSAGLEITQKGDLIYLSGKNITGELKVDIHVEDRAHGIASAPFTITLIAPQGESPRTQKIVFALSLIALAVFLAAIIFDMTLAKRKATEGNREQTLNNLMNPNFVSRGDKEPYQP